MICPDDLDITAFVESVDPDWTDHFVTIDNAFSHYWKYLNDSERKRAMDEAGYEQQKQDWWVQQDQDDQWIHDNSQ